MCACVFACMRANVSCMRARDDADYETDICQVLEKYIIMYHRVLTTECTEDNLLIRLDTEGEELCDWWVGVCVCLWIQSVM